MSRKAVQYSLDDFNEKYPDKNSVNLEIYIDEKIEAELLEFIERNLVHFFFRIRHIANGTRNTNVFKKAIHGHFEMIFKKCARDKKNNLCNARIYCKQKRQSGKLMLIFDHFIENKKTQKIDPKTQDQLKNLDKEQHILNQT